MIGGNWLLRGDWLLGGRERQVQRFKSPPQAQRFLSSHVMIYGHSRPRRHLMTADRYRRVRAKAFRVGRQETRAQIAA